VIVANRWSGAELAFGTTARGELIEGAHRFLMIVKLSSLFQSRSWIDERKLTEGQQESPQHVSPGPQKVSEQQVEFLGMQKGAMSIDCVKQHVSASSINHRALRPTNCSTNAKTYRLD
jgi:hypothetical protein